MAAEYSMLLRRFARQVTERLTPAGAHACGASRYATCRAELDRTVIPQQMANAGCVSGCADTADMAAAAGTGSGSGGASTDTVCEAPMVFESNAPGSPQLLCSTNLCATFASRGDACRYARRLVCFCRRALLLDTRSLLTAGLFCSIVGLCRSYYSRSM